MHRYIPNTDAEKKEMLDSIGVSSIEDLFSDIPSDLRFQGDLNIGKGLSELEVVKHMQDLVSKNKTTEELTCFLGAGTYDHYIPSIVKHLAFRSEFYTAYTPYQPEISQGTLQIIFEYQSMICNLTGMDVTNASMYDGPTACVEAAILACSDAKKDKIIVSKSVNPETREVLKPYLHARNLEIVEVDTENGATNLEQLKSLVDEDTAGVIVQSPNFFGIIEDVEEVEKITRQAKKAKLIMYTDPISLAVLKSPKDMNVDIVVGDAQVLGSPMAFGGPHIGFLAVNSKLVRKIPGRIVGQTEDVDGNRAFVLTLQAREQHIRRYKATSNICSNQGLNAIMTTIYLTTMGKEGLREVALQSTQKAHYAFNELTKSGKYKPLFPGQSFFKEFAVTSDKCAKEVNEGLLKENILGGYELSKDYSELANGLLLAVTEKRTKEEIDKLVSAMEVL
ncbi:glycine dehydrogenase [decarboxylating] subunit 1 [Gottschalkia acidurici 9a]|uniref:Probable glycine dehydrogenase (decarboxylating) subunit 1 n=1 Tax=Gottschalkia acidurici (strain ATCC 7906 / DSM 604 / BCRC 14475 / CIP 104303 / KCTC 5404 / NCIMB 10678 / 9a) TaxID=1128398 RepID=K0AWL4_GOTA9|nr:aminomethyl-transferring glycine dehydrogenase subunit GcvPA [Gottschalkia acidurici]AFS77157.1 glycine dehydrogenase [decarboxylating] subunit 1 [Gottschalkia acidurici 9a]